MKDNAKKRLSFSGIVFYFLLIILAVFAFFHFTELQKFLLLLEKINPLWFIPAFLCQMLTYTFVANIFHSFLNELNYKSAISRWNLFKLSIVNLFLNQAIPIGGLSGQGYSIYFFQKRKLPAHIGLIVTILEAFTYYITHFLFAVFVTLFLIFRLKEKFSGILVGISFLGMLVFLFLGVLFLILGNKKTAVSIVHKSTRSRWLNFILRKLNLEFAEKDILLDQWEGPWEFIKSKKKDLIKPLFFQAMVILADTFTAFFLFYGFGFHPNFLIILVSMVLTKIIAAISISPGALVFFEGAMVLFYTSFNIPLQLAIMVTILFRALSFWLPMPFGLFLYKHLSKNQD